jgi:hypothetical protein
MNPYENPKIEAIIEKNNPFRHYYGDVIRKIFLVIAFAMLVMTPFFQNYIGDVVHLSVFAVVILVCLSGFMSPQQKLVKVFSFLVSLVGVLVFGQDAVRDYLVTPWTFEGMTIAISVLFLLALYFSAKTIREAFLK